MADTKWLEKRRQGWYAVVYVPADLQSVLGKKLRQSLKTRDLKEAQTKRHVVLAELKRRIAEARRPAADKLIAEAMALREAVARAKNGSTEVIGYGAEEIGQEAALRDYIADRAGEIAERRGNTQAEAFLGLALSRATPLGHYVDDWLLEGGAKGPLRERTKAQYRTDIARLEAWAKGAHVPAVLEAFDRRTAGRFVADAIVGAGVNRKTGNRWVSAVSAYWKWMVRRGHVDSNTWIGQSLPKGGAVSGKRPFTDGELTALLNGPAIPEIADAMRVAALSGMRIEEIYRLSVADCSGGWFNVRSAKTSAGVRKVPIHSDLAAIVTSRCAGKPSGAYLFHEAGGPAKPGRERSMYASRKFGVYRRHLDIHERAEGQRQSNVDFHSFRRWFATAAERADQPPNIISAVLGHEEGRKGMTLSVYSGGPSEPQLRACVEAVRLPASVGQPAVSCLATPNMNGWVAKRQESR